MKKTVAALALLAIGGTTIFGGQAAHAVEATVNEDVTTEGDVKFTPNTDGTGGLIKPGTVDDTIKVADGAASKGALRITNVPSFRFGTVSVSAQATSYPSLLTTYQTTSTDKDGIVTEGTKKVKIPQFVQVADERGEAEGVFKVTAKATKFTEQDVAEGKIADVLENTRIQFYGQTLRNNVLDKDAVNKVDADATEILAGMNVDPAAEAGKPIGELNDTTALPILSTKVAGGANGSISSIVFDGSYTTDKEYDKLTDGKGNPLTTNDQVKLSVPAGESPKSNVTYKSTITWNLTNVL
ncbi:hypothetical protein IGJ55_002748 [Enterococcus sp. AZ170]|uniref:WxL domain-containing protein n=1 Tax=unclassified Enterococcus TaxID=2608891 RepID=UPI003D27078C